MRTLIKYKDVLECSLVLPFECLAVIKDRGDDGLNHI